MAFSINVSASVCKALSARAHAGRQWPDLGFSDQFAQLLAQLLDISLKQRMPLPEERRLIERCQWFDDCCRHFFQRHPKAMCIELGAGLSTRFHRLSDTADWPRFQWVDIDMPQVTVSIAQVLPHIDNYTLIGADIMVDDWLRVSGWVEGQPLLVLMEGVAAELGGNATLQLIYRLRQQAASSRELELVLDDAYPGTWKAAFKNIALGIGVWFGLSIRNSAAALPVTHCTSTLEYFGFKITHNKNLLGGRTLGLVMNYKNKECL